MKRLLQISAVFIMMSAIFELHNANGLDCYQCSSLEDPKCGDSWRFAGSEGDHFLVTCPMNGTVNATACRKYVLMNIGSGTFLTYRSCWYPHWNHTAADEEYTPTGCEHYYGWRASRVCYCTDHTRACNSESRLAMSPWTVLIGLLGGLVLTRTHLFNPYPSEYSV